MSAAVVTLSPLDLMDGADYLSGADRSMTAAELQETFRNLPSREAMEQAWNDRVTSSDSAENRADSSEKRPDMGVLPQTGIPGRSRPVNAPERWRRNA